MSKDGEGWPPFWTWALEIERRVSRLEAKVKPRLNNTDDDTLKSRWTPRDYLMAGAGISMVIGALTEKSGLTAVGIAILKAAARVYGEH